MSATMTYVGETDKEFFEGVLAWAAELPPLPRRSPVVYLMGTEPDAPVKIGYCTRRASVRERCAKLQTGNPARLRIHQIFTVLSQGAEEDLHDLFAHARIRGEWFDPTQDERLRALIAGRTEPEDYFDYTWPPKTAAT